MVFLWRLFPLSLFLAAAAAAAAAVAVLGLWPMCPLSLPRLFSLLLGRMHPAVLQEHLERNPHIASNEIQVLVQTESVQAMEFPADSDPKGAEEAQSRLTRQTWDERV